MKKIYLTFLLMIFISLNFAQGKRVLIEVLTNSHCPNCVQAYAAINSYLATGGNKDNVDLIFYHMVFPYSDDPIYQANPADASARNNYYGPFGGTPVTFFNGVNQGQSYSSWPSVIDNYSAETSPFQVSLSGTISDTDSKSITVKADMSWNGQSAASDLTINFVVVEDVIYAGRNGISDHKNSMRKMLTGGAGENFSFDNGSQKEITKTIQLDNSWDVSKLSVVVFVQSASAKTVYQSATIDYSEMIITGIEEIGNGEVPEKFRLEQNYPNPFNPSTKINYFLSEKSDIELVVYNIFGEQVEVLYKGSAEPGIYTASFDGKNLASGVYLYKLRAGNQVSTKKMMLIK